MFKVILLIRFNTNDGYANDAMITFASQKNVSYSLSSVSTWSKVPKECWQYYLKPKRMHPLQWADQTDINGNTYRQILSHYLLFYSIQLKRPRTRTLQLQTMKKNYKVVHFKKSRQHLTENCQIYVTAWSPFLLISKISPNWNTRLTTVWAK